MILINTFHNYFDNFINIVDIKHVIYITHEEEVKLLKEMTGNIMLVVEPSAIPDSDNLDSCQDINISFLYVLQKKDESSINPVVHKQMFSDTQAVILAVREELKKDAADYSGACHFMHGLDLNSMIIDPVGYYKGWRGWNMAMQFKL